VSSTASTSSTISAPLSTSGAEISSGAGADSLTGGAGDDRFGLTGRTETITLTYTAGDTVALTANGVAAATVTAATNLATYRAAVIAEINKTSATSFVTAAAGTAAGEIVVTYSQWFGVAGALSTNTGSESIAITTAGDNAGADTISGGVGADTINGGTGADSITGGTGLDTYQFSAGDSALTIGGTGNSGTIGGFDTYVGFALGTASTDAETLDWIGGTASVVGNTAGANGTDSSLTIGGTAVKSHAITSGIVTFDDADTFATALSLTSWADVAAVVQYLQANDLGNAGVSVAFTATIGTTAYTFVFTQGDDDGTNNLDVLAALVGVTGTSLSATNGNTAGLIDLG